MKRVIIESPFAGGDKFSEEENITYAREALLDSIDRGEAPFASHLLYTQVLDDSIPQDRVVGMVAGYAWIGSADLMALYVDHGISKGMLEGIRKAKERGIPIEERWIHREG